MNTPTLPTTSSAPCRAARRALQRQQRKGYQAPPRRGSKRGWAPMLVIVDQIKAFALREYEAARAFRDGYATSAHYNDLVECHNMLASANKLACKAEGSCVAVCAVAHAALSNVFDLYQQDDIWRADAAEQATFDALVSMSQDYWPRQTQQLFDKCYNKVRKHLAQMEDQAT